MKAVTDIHVRLWMNCEDFDDPLFNLSSFISASLILQIRHWQNRCFSFTCSMLTHCNKMLAFSLLASRSKHHCVKVHESICSSILNKTIWTGIETYATLGEST